MGAAQLGIVVVVMIMGTAPHAARAESENAKNAHEALGDFRARQDRVMLLVVVNDEKPHENQPGEHTANEPGDKRETRKRTGQRDDQHGEGR